METQQGSVRLRVVTWVSAFVMLLYPRVSAAYFILQPGVILSERYKFCLQNINGLRSLLVYAKEGLAPLFKRLDADIGEP